MKDVFIVNPKSGKNSQYELIQEVKEHFQGKRIIIEKTKGPEHAINWFESQGQISDSSC